MRTAFAHAGLVLLLAGAATASKLEEAVVKDFQAGLAGDREALDRAIKAAEEALAHDSKDAEALAWHGAATFYLCGQAYEVGDIVKGQELWDKGLKEMADAVALEPDGIGARTVRWQVLSAAVQHPMMPPEMAAQLLEIAMPDGEKILSAQGDNFNKLPAEYRGALLMGLARGWDQLGKEDKAKPAIVLVAILTGCGGWDQLGKEDKAKPYFERILKDLPGSEFEKKAKEWLDAGRKKQ